MLPIPVRGSHGIVRSNSVFLLLFVVFGLVGGGMLLVPYGGFADDWLVENARCGSGSSTNLPRCEPGEAQAVLGPLGAVFVGVALLMGLLGRGSVRSERRAARRSAAALRAPAIVLERSQAQTRLGRVTIASGKVELLLRVDPPGGTSFETWIEQSALGTLEPGAAVTVRYDPSRPDEVFVEEPAGR
jgi:hypothetical protein